MQDYNSTNFDQEVLNSSEPVLVDFWAPWCGPCKMIGSIVEDLAKEMKGVKIGKVNLDVSPEIAQRFSVMSLPTLLFFKEGKVMDQMIGIQPKGEIQSKLEELK